MSTALSVWKIGAGACHEISLEDLADVRIEHGEFAWMDITAQPDHEFIIDLEQQLGLHELALGNLFDKFRSPRLLEFKDHILIGARVVHEQDDDLSLVNFGVVLGRGYVITAHEQPLSIVKRTLERVKANNNKVLQSGPDRLLHLLLDTLVDDYYAQLDHLSEAVDSIDDRATDIGRKPDLSIQRDILATKRQLLTIHRAISPLRDALLNIRRSHKSLITEPTELYLRDVFEHLLQLIEIVETYREILSSTAELILAASGNRMNEIITFLTVFSTFFFPINFITSFYGMNLVMPETHLQATYPVLITLMILMIAFMFVWFKRKKWL